MQLFDLELFRALLINYKLQTDEPSNPQRWTQSWEAVLEAFRQTLIQLFCVTKTNTLDPSIVFSVFWSLWSIIIIIKLAMNMNYYLAKNVKNQAISV